eukprot:364639-Chlamydomonas_euryale.AAC.3
MDRATLQVNPAHRSIGRCPFPPCGWALALAMHVETCSLVLFVCASLHITFVCVLSSLDSGSRPRTVLWPIHGLRQCVTNHPNTPQSCKKVTSRLLRPAQHVEGFFQDVWGGAGEFAPGYAGVLPVSPPRYVIHQLCHAKPVTPHQVLLEESGPQPCRWPDDPAHDQRLPFYP